MTIETKKGSTPKVKHCRMCDTTKELYSNFFKAYQKIDGTIIYVPYCRPCWSKRCKDFRDSKEGGYRPPSYNKHYKKTGTGFKKLSPEKQKALYEDIEKYINEKRTKENSLAYIAKKHNIKRPTLSIWYKKGQIKLDTP